MNHYKVKPNSPYGKALKQARKDQAALIAVANAVRTELGLPHTNMVSQSPGTFYHPPDHIPAEFENQFKKDGFAKKNSKVYKHYAQAVEQAGLTDMDNEAHVSFGYGIMRLTQAQTMRRMTIENVDYIETNTEFNADELSHLEPITEVEFYEVRIAALKKTNAS